jgi:transcriptional regulator with XRE-family HTH domain
VKDVFHTLLRERRQQQGKSPSEVAAVVGLSAPEYYDLESSPDEWRMVIPTFTIKMLIRWLGVDMREAIGSIDRNAEFSNFRQLSDIIRARRIELGLSEADFADKAGFDPAFTTIVEGHPLGLELYPLEVVTLVADARQLSASDLLAWVLQH